MTSALAQPAVSPLGTIRLASFVTNGSGSGKGRLRRYPSYALVSLLDGLGYYRDSTGFSQPVIPGDLIWVSPRVWHTTMAHRKVIFGTSFLSFSTARSSSSGKAERCSMCCDRCSIWRRPSLWIERLTKVCQTSTRTANSATAAIIDLQSILLDLITLQTKTSGTSRRVAGLGRPYY